MNKFQRHFKSLPETEASFSRVPPMGVTVITQGDGWVRGVTRMPNPGVSQIPKGVSLDTLKGLNIRHMDINLDPIEPNS